ncbi:DUF1993 domain-containing protein [Synechococcus sp. CBW1002]|jgi:hypothetical protein|uniref:DUF1993 domain-containing protein n=1 Tax=Synechococcus sp. CBW1002 TaxID=1353134 RepID=UPI0018CE142C|nr:DUF1993 domain-containing protein [Synechococcus sp. CBW1002]QPN60374.1 DUF1993 domain-containing protein [Synechococcus sp. CBW1002]
MQLSMVDASVLPLTRTLTNLAAVLAKGQAHAEAHSIDPAVLLQSRLYPDMFPLVRQVQIASDIARRGVARLAGSEAPAVEDSETSFAELIERLQHTITFIESVPTEQLNGSEERLVTVPIGRDQTITMPGWPFLSSFVLPNVYFHVTTAYNILRHNGVVLGKRDFLGAS